MAWTKYQLFLAFVLVVTGSINTLSTKWADKLSSEGSDGKIRTFEHPFVQACSMFLGEIMCLFVFKAAYFYYKRKQDGSVDTNGLVKGNRNFNPFVLFIPAMCDMLATSIMYIGLNFTYASSFQMFRGSVIIFVGLLSVGFLERTLKSREWVGIMFVIVGLAIVGMSDFFNQSSQGRHGRNNIITGDLLIVIAQIITSVQMVVEEKFVSGLDIPPLQAVGWEGVFGFVTLGLLQIPFYYISVPAPFNHNAHGVLEDLPDALAQMSNNYQLIFAILGTIISIAFFNFAGISVTKEISATTRMVLDSVRTLVIWLFALALRWQDFHWPQIIGFTGLVFGMCLYNNVTLKLCADPIRTRWNNYRNIQEEEEVVNRPADLSDTA